MDIELNLSLKVALPLPISLSFLISRARRGAVQGGVASLVGHLPLGDVYAPLTPKLVPIMRDQNKKSEGEGDFAGLPPSRSILR